MTDYTRIAGIDISKSVLDLCVLPEKLYFTFDNTDKGVRTLLKKLLSYPSVERIILEATGGYERRVLEALQSKNLAVCRVNAAQIRHFAKATGRLAKTDRIDAFVLADYGMRLPTQTTPQRTEKQRELMDLVARYRQVRGMIVQEKNRLDKQVETTKTMIADMLAFMEVQRKILLRRIQDCVEQEPALSEAVAVLITMKGIGFLTACILVAELPELGHLDKGKIVKLVGVAPINRDSGTMRGKRAIHGGRKTVRNALYIAALPAIRFNPVMRDFYNKLKKKANPVKWPSSPS